jgi:hypothetical protein
MSSGVKTPRNLCDSSRGNNMDLITRIAFSVEHLDFFWQKQGLIVIAPVIG